jgi:hypothetical protein
MTREERVAEHLAALREDICNFPAFLLKDQTDPTLRELQREWDEALSRVGVKLKTKHIVWDTFNNKPAPNIDLSYGDNLGQFVIKEVPCLA